MIPAVAEKTAIKPLLVLADAWGLYRLLFRRSIGTAALILTPYSLLDLRYYVTSSELVLVPIGLASFVLSFAIRPLVQGALILIVEDVHEGRRPRGTFELLRATRRRLGRLVGASLLYGLGVVFGLLLLIVPGLRAAARWCLLAPLIMLEGKPVGVARERSSKLVTPQTSPILSTLLIVFVASGALPWVDWLIIHPAYYQRVLIGLAWNIITVPFQAHVLNVLYYRLAERSRPIVHEAVRGWRSVWAGA